jgi:hypothetical protein
MAPEYTIEDMKVLAGMSDDESIPANFLPDMDYDPETFKKFLVDNGLVSDAHYLYELPLEDVPLLIDKGNVSGYLRFRFTVGK